MGIGRAELLILLGAIAIFGRYSLTINAARYNNDFRIIACESQTVAASIADGVIETAVTKGFDEATVSTILSGGLTSLTEPNLLGAESGEVYPDFDDIDDFDGFTMSDTAVNGIQFEITSTVGYVSEDDPVNLQSDQTYLKRLNVTVSSEFIPEPVTISRVFSYYNY
ncbi:MAG: hypothetical protein PHW79_03740 [Candidatus Marinimicrobia bacterium]|nr:hypothetical protein [Candidatus Neomarinimicrobiota bacterium]